MIVIQQKGSVGRESLPGRPTAAPTVLKSHAVPAVTGPCQRRRARTRHPGVATAAPHVQRKRLRGGEEGARGDGAVGPRYFVGASTTPPSTSSAIETQAGGRPPRQGARGSDDVAGAPLAALPKATLLGASGSGCAAVARHEVPGPKATLQTR